MGRQGTMAAAYIYTRKTIMRTPAQILRIILRIVLAFTLGAGALLLATALFLRQNPHALAEHLANSIRSRTGLECSMGLVDVAMLPVPALAVADVYIHSADFSLSVAYATVRPSFSALLRGEFEPGDITLLRPEVSLTRDSLPLPALGEAQPGPTPSPALLLTVPDKLQNCRIMVQHGSVEITARDGRRLRMTDIRTDISPQSPSTLDGWFNVGTAILWEKDRIAAQVDNLQVDMSGAVLALHRGSTGRIRLQGRGFVPHSLRIAHLDINVEQRAHKESNIDPSGTISANMQGSFPWKGQDIPFHVAGRGKNTGQGTFAIEAADIGLDKDRLRMEAVVTLPRTGQPADILPSIRGTLTLHRLSLVQWFGFGRVLPPGLQKTLDNLSGSLDFICNRQGLQVPHLQVAVADTSFEGQGSVESWATPVILIDAKSTQLRLDTALPEARGQFPAALAFPHLPLTPQPGTDAADSMPGPDINYDIRLAVDNVQYGPLHVGGARFRCVPQGKGLVDMTFGSSSLYGGNLEGSLLLGGGAHSTSYAIKAQLKNIAAEKPLHLLTGGKWLGGRLSASAQWKTEGKSITAFLNNLTGSSSLRLEEGYCAPSFSAGEAGKIPFSRLEMSSKLRGPKSAQGGSEVSAKLPAFLTFEGEWQGLMHTKDWQASVRMDGPVSFSRTKGLPLYFQKIPASVSVNMQQELTGLTQPIKSHASGRFSFHSGNKTLDVEDAHMTAEGLELRGNIQSTLSDLAAKGDVSLKSTQLRRVLGLFDSTSLTSSLPAKALQEVEVQARMHLTHSSLRMEKMRAKIDSTHVAGTMEGQWNARPSWKFDLNADSFDLALYRQSAAAGASASTTPWNLKLMQSVDAQGTLRINTARLFKFSLQNLHIPVRLNKGLLECSTLRAQLYDAPLTGSLRAEVKKGLVFRLGLKAHNVNMLPLTTDQGLSTVLAGRAAFSSTTQGTLHSAADFPAALQGDYSGEVLNGYFQSRKTSAAGNAQNGGKTAFNFLRATGQMTQGILRNNDFIMDGSSMRVSGQGWINFGTAQLDYTALVRMGNIAEFPVRYYGPLSNPQRHIQAGKAIVDTLGQLGTDVFGLVGDVLSTPFKFFR